jgi:hypothetical protein
VPSLGPVYLYVFFMPRFLILTPNLGLQAYNHYGVKGMAGVIVKKSLIVLLAFAICTTLVWAAGSSDSAKRGDYPACQRWCLDRLEKRMADYFEEYKRTGDKLAYEERVERARLDYDDCITNCKVLIPVK